MAFPRVEALSDEYVGRIVLLTDRTNEEPDRSAVADCSFSSWPPDDITLWEGIVVEWRNRGGTDILTGGPQVRAERLAQRQRIFVPDGAVSIELGTPFIINAKVDCPGEFVGVTATRVPGIRIITRGEEDIEGGPQE